MRSPTAGLTPGHKAPATGLAQPLVGIDNQFTAQHHLPHLSGHSLAFKQREIAIAMLILGRDHMLLAGIEQNNVGVTADRDSALLGKQPKKLGRGRAG